MVDSINNIVKSCPFADDGHKAANNSNSMERTFLLPDIIQFGYHSLHSRQISVSGDGLKATKMDPVSHYAHGVCYGDKPLRGLSEFEVKITSYGTGWSGTMKLGVMRCKAGSQIDVITIPRYSPEGTDHCVWSSNKIHNRFSDVLESDKEKPYGKVNLDDLCEDYRVGLQLTHDGVLSFFVNGKNQGRAAENIYKKGYDVYIVVDHYANCKATYITRAAMRIELNLEDLCVELVASWLKASQDAHSLPLPVKLRDRLIKYISE